MPKLAVKMLPAKEGTLKTTNVQEEKEFLLKPPYIGLGQVTTTFAVFSHEKQNQRTMKNE